MWPRATPRLHPIFWHILKKIDFESTSIISFILNFLLKSLIFSIYIYKFEMTLLPLSKSGHPTWKVKHCDSYTYIRCWHTQLVTVRGGKRILNQFHCYHCVPFDISFPTEFVIESFNDYFMLCSLVVFVFCRLRVFFHKITEFSSITSECKVISKM